MENLETCIRSFEAYLEARKRVDAYKASLMPQKTSWNPDLNVEYAARHESFHADKRLAEFKDALTAFVVELTADENVRAVLVAVAKETLPEPEKAPEKPVKK